MPPELDLPITRARAVQIYQQPQQMIEPQIDGYASSYFEWIGAGSYEAGTEQGAMFRAERNVERLHFGFSEEALFLRLDFTKWNGATSLIAIFYAPRGFVLKTKPLTREGAQKFTIITPGGVELKRETIAAADIVEWEIALLDLVLK